MAIMDEAILEGTASKDKGQRYDDDITRVGEDKPLGYILLRTIRENHGDPEEMARAARERGLFAEVHYPGNSPLSGGGENPFENAGDLMVADIESLRELLINNRGVLEEFGWPIDPYDFIEKHRWEDPPFKTKLFDLIADAYADKNNPGRTDVSGPEAPTI